LTEFVALLAEHHIRYCVLDGQGGNAYVEPVVSLDIDLVIAVDQLPEVERLVTREFTVKRQPHSLNLSEPGSDLRAQIQTDPRYPPFVERATVREVLGLRLPVASLEDLLQGKIWAASDPGRRGSKRQKDLADTARLLEAYPQLRERVPSEILSRLI
jgi:hypothetical protein